MTKIAKISVLKATLMLMTFIIFHVSVAML